MSAVTKSLVVSQAQTFAPKEEGWSESVKCTFAASFDGFAVNSETGVKEAVEVNHFSLFIGEFVKAMCATSSTISAFMSSKSHEEKVKLMPVLLAGAKIEFTRELDEEEKEWITTLGKITLTPDTMTRVNRALDALFGF